MNSNTFPGNPLPPLWEAFQILQAEQPQMTEELISKIQVTESESRDLFILGLWATFERFLRSYLQHKGEALKQTVTPPNLADSLYQHFAKQV